jgi:hypothetical protein
MKIKYRYLTVKLPERFSCQIMVVIHIPWCDSGSAISENVGLCQYLHKIPIWVISATHVTEVFLHMLV